MLRSEVLNQLLKLYNEPAYLEIGVEFGTTFLEIAASKKVAVDPVFGFAVPAATAAPQGVQFHQMRSDEFFSIAPKSELFDVIFIDGLHTFEQTLRDFTNAIEFMKPGGIIVIDDVKPSSYYASLTNDVSARLRAATGDNGREWMGDVYKLVYFIETYFQQYSFATVAESLGQMVVWKSTRSAASLGERSVETISRTDFAGVVLDNPYNIAPLKEIIARIAAGGVAGSTEAVKYISCDPQKLYSQGGFYDPEATVDQLELTFNKCARSFFETICELFPSELISREVPGDLFGCDDDAKTKQQEWLTRATKPFEKIAPCLLVKISNACLWNNILFHVVAGRGVPIYENYRWCDRNLPHTKILDGLESAVKNKIDCSKSAYLFVGSAGSFNYGHWLVDDFPRYVALNKMQALGLTPKLVCSSFDQAMNQVRADAVAYAVSNTPKPEVAFVDPKQLYEFDEIYFATPVSYHPVQKSSAAIEFIELAASRACGNLGETASASSPKVFVNRSTKWPRRIVNEDEIRVIFLDYGFIEIFPEFMSLREQINAFRSAERVVGIMGAAMTNTAFSSSETTIVHLAPDGWIEPFYWDLAERKQQSYQVIFGPPVQGGLKAFQCSFSLDAQLLDQRLQAILSK